MKTLDKDICIQCGTCAVDCPMGLIQIHAYPEIPEELQVLCNQCGHCEVICPEGAIGSTNSENKEDQTINNITPQEMGWHMKFRRSIRNYRDKPVERETMEKIFDVVRYAPSAGNGQPVQWTVITDPEKIQKIAAGTIEWMREMANGDSPLNDMIPFAPMIEAWDNGKDPILRNAPGLVVAHAPEENQMAFTDGIIALTHLDLALPTFQMGGCWAGLLNIACNQYPKLKSIMGVPDGNAVIYPFMVGYPKYDYHGIPERNEASIIWE